MEFTAKIIADYLKGEIVGNPDVAVTNVCKIEEGKTGNLAFLANPKYEKYLYKTEASIVLINKDIDLKESTKATLIKVDNAYSSFASLLELYQQQKVEKTGIDDQTSIDKSAKIGDNVYIGSFTFVGINASIGNNVKLYPQVYIGDNVKIGDNTVIHPGVKVYEDCIIGKNCIIHAGTIIGSDGFGFAPREGEEFKKIPQIGNVIIEDHVEIGANVTIDRATMGSTIIRKGVKLDNLLQLAHNVEIGENTVIAAQTGIAGSTKVGANNMIGAQAGIVGHISIADNVKIGARSGIASNVRKEGVSLLGAPAHDSEDAKKSMILIRYLPDMRKKIQSLESELNKLKQKG